MSVFGYYRELGRTDLLYFGYYPIVVTSNQKCEPCVGKIYFHIIFGLNIEIKLVLCKFLLNVHNLCITIFSTLLFQCFIFYIKNIELV